MSSLKSGFVFIASPIASYVIVRWLNLLENLVPDFLPHLNVVDVIFLGIVGFGIYLVLRNQFTKSNNEKIDDTNKKIHNELIEDKISAYKPIMESLINMHQRFYKIYNLKSEREKQAEAVLLKKVSIPRNFRPLKNNSRLNSDVAKQYNIYCDMLELDTLIPDLITYKQMLQNLIDELEKHMPKELVSQLNELKKY